jgi:hypothetical protein
MRNTTSSTPPAVGNRRHPQLDVERGEFLELDLAVLRPPFFRNVEVAHDLDARHDRAAKAMRDLDVFLQRAVTAETDRHFFLADARLDVNVRSPLLIGVYDDFVDQPDELVISRGGDFVDGFRLALARPRPSTTTCR